MLEGHTSFGIVSPPPHLSRLLSRAVDNSCPQVKIVFGLNALSSKMTQGYGGKQSVIAGVPWDSDNVRAFLEHSKQKRYVEQGSLYGFELGNEIQGPAHSPPDGKVHRGLDAPFHADQFSRLSSMIRCTAAR